ncbi:M23 family metallopeptidase [Parabacteroides sp. HGS0025]|uniref:M23 family metallopeptidase n=1 Tax=Parabacteroides sp. HGS0025 TaxID=1078087 RepID=UPI0006173AEE|nr:M23 family metallopeptidase [Parabacteroides sp. HGS0025]
MRYKILFFAMCLYLPMLVVGQPNDTANRKSEIEAFTTQVYSVREFQQIADSLLLSIDELCDYPVIFPIRKTTRISSGFGMRRHPISKVRQFHTGIDIPEVKGTPVYATGNGVVSRKGYGSGYGYFIEITHAGNFRSFYAHLGKTLVNVGDEVSIAQQIGCVGNTGISTGRHLHYEIRKDKRYLNPKEWCYCLFDVFKIKS